MSDGLFIVGGRVLDPASGTDGVRTVVVRDGKIAEVSERVDRPKDARAVDARGKWVTPGFVDLHVHLREPGQEYKETVASGRIGQVVSGVAVVFHCERRARVLLRDILRFGTATASSLSSRHPGR